MSISFQPQEVIAHRGASAYAPENTLIAMHKAYELGARWVEFDVMLTEDGVPVVIHDETLARTTNGRGQVSRIKHAKLAQLDAGSWFAAEFAGEKVPALAELLDYLASHGFTPNIEIKPCLGQDEATARKTLEVLARHWPASAPEPLISSFSKRALHVVQQERPQLQLGLLLESWPQHWEQCLEGLRCVSVNIDHAALTPERIAGLRAQGYWVLTYTVNTVVRAQQLFAWGVSAVFSDYPDLLHPALRLRTG